MALTLNLMQILNSRTVGACQLPAALAAEEHLQTCKVRNTIETKVQCEFLRTPLFQTKVLTRKILHPWRRAEFSAPSKTYKMQGVGFLTILIPVILYQSNLFILGAPKSLQMVTAAMKLKDACSLEKKI